MALVWDEERALLVAIRQGIDLDIVVRDLLHHFRLQPHQFGLRKTIGFGNDGNNIDLVGEIPHDFNVQRFQSMAVWIDEVKATVHSVIHDIFAVETTFIAQVSARE